MKTATKHSNGSLVTLSAKIASADAIGNSWLARANDAAEKGDQATADKFYAKHQFWLDRSNKLRGNA